MRRRRQQDRRHCHSRNFNVVWISSVHGTLYNGQSNAWTPHGCSYTGL